MLLSQSNQTPTPILEGRGGTRTRPTVCVLETRKNTIENEGAGTCRSAAATPNAHSPRSLLAESGPFILAQSGPFANLNSSGQIGQTADVLALGTVQGCTSHECLLFVNSNFVSKKYLWRSICVVVARIERVLGGVIIVLVETKKLTMSAGRLNLQARKASATVLSVLTLARACMPRTTDTEALGWHVPAC